ILEDADIFISIPEKDGLSVSVLEAVQMRVPLILSDIPVNRYLIGSVEPASLVASRPDISRNIFESVLYFLENKAAGENSAELLYNMWSPRISFKETVSGYLKIYRELFALIISRDFPVKKVCEIYEGYILDSEGIPYIESPVKKYWRRDRFQMRPSLQYEFYNPTTYIEYLIYFNNYTRESMKKLLDKFDLRSGFSFRLPGKSQEDPEESITSGLTIMLGLSLFIRFGKFEKIAVNRYLTFLYKKMITAGLFVNISKDLSILKGYSKVLPALICEYKNDPFILNGAAISLISLIEYYSYVGRNSSKRRNVRTAAVKSGSKRFTIDRVRNYIDGLEILVRMSDSFLWSFYDCKRKITANRYYHSLHIDLLRFLYD
ncbi:MAG: hypothetical protein KAS39_03995, partial [Actinomycetia bacterium]|nr:hypothetical protein [Actinomycetes bacterium]